MRRDRLLAVRRRADDPNGGVVLEHLRDRDPRERTVVDDRTRSPTLRTSSLIHHVVLQVPEVELRRERDERLDPAEEEIPARNQPLVEGRDDDRFAESSR